MQDILLMVGPYGDWVKYNLDESVELVTEIDGVCIQPRIYNTALSAWQLMIASLFLTFKEHMLSCMLFSLHSSSQDARGGAC